jgi:hypothetical protein
VLVSFLKLDRVGWSCDDPRPGFEVIRGHLSFSPGRIQCHVDGIAVRPHPGGFYGGWVTPETVGPYRGDQGTAGW